jgi:hypothetical protein
MKQYYSKVWKYYLNKNKILLYIIKSTTLACICLATWKHNDNFLCSENYYSTTTILDIAPIDVVIGKKLLLQYLSLIMKQYNSKVWKYYLNMNRILLWIMKKYYPSMHPCNTRKHNDKFLCYENLLLQYC